MGQESVPRGRGSGGGSQAEPPLPCDGPQVPWGTVPAAHLLCQLQKTLELLVLFVDSQLLSICSCSDRLLEGLVIKNESKDWACGSEVSRPQFNPWYPAQKRMSLGTSFLGPTYL